MAEALIRPQSLQEFLDWERRQPERYEYLDCAARMRTGGSLDHATIAGNLLAELRDKLRGTRCRPFNDDAKVVGDGQAIYPDVSVTCSEIDSGENDVMPDPVVIVEVVSPSSERVDCGQKKFRCFATPSVQHYAVVEQDAIRVDLYTRVGDVWTNTILEGPDAVMRLTAIGVEIRLAALYEGTSLAA